MKHNILLVLIFLLASCATQQRYSPQTIQIVGEYRQESTGLTFPERVNNFNRVTITKYNTEATDIGVAYNHSSKPIALTLYSYPAQMITSLGSSKEVIEIAKKHLFNSAYERSKQDIIDGHENSKLIKESEYRLELTGLEYIGIHASFTYSEVFAGKHQKVASHLYLTQVKDALLKYRITYPENASVEVEISEFIKSYAQREHT